MGFHKQARTEPVVKYYLFRIAVARKSKAARGKRRWVGISIDGEYSSIDGLIKRTAENSILVKVAWVSSDAKYIILEVRLEHYRDLVRLLDDQQGVTTVTSSGKIRLVKERLDRNCD